MKDSIACAVCGKVFEVAHRKNQRAKFCSRPCWAADWAKRQKGDGNVAKKAGVGAKISAAHKASGRFVGERSPNWKGGTYKEGPYWYVRIGLGEYRKRSHVNWNEAHPDDPILPGQIIHHMNHVKDDDRPENLIKLGSQSEHALEHDLGGKALARGRDAKGRIRKAS